MRKLLILFLCLLFYGCNSKPKIIQVKLQPEELQVIKDTFPTAICCYWQQMEYGFQPFNNENREEENIRFKKWADSIYQHLPKKLSWFVKDTLYNLKDISLNKEYHQNKRLKFDTSFNKLEKDLFNVLKYPKQTTKLTGLTIGNYTFLSAGSLDKQYEIPKRRVAFSRVAFNPMRNKACYYVTQALSKNNWADGEMIYVEKKQGKWFMLYRRLYWIT